MPAFLTPLSFIITSIAGWLTQYQQNAIHYLVEENRVLREQIGNRKLRFTDDQRRRLAVRAKELSRKILVEVATIVTPETLLAWHRRLIALSGHPKPAICGHQKSGHSTFVRPCSISITGQRWNQAIETCPQWRGKKDISH
jgi:hypothetical protein